PALERLVEFHVGAGTQGIVAVGTTGESATLTEDEHVETIRTIIDAAAGRVPVIAGTGANSTHEAIRLTREAQELGADACLLVTPYYNRPTQAGMYEHFRAVAEAVAVPQILYNVPARCGVDLANDTALALARHSNIIGIKDATGNIERAVDLLARAPEDFAVYSGDDPTARELMLAGGHGNVSVTANVVPELMARLCRAAIAGDADEAAAIDERLAALTSALFLEPNPIPVKWALAHLGIIGPGIRLPLTPLDHKLEAVVRDALAGVLP
ncbi:MAG TPA: 4-hydroxy-tetrahydrodipicolinate synthase, partial [Pseudohaliea sp.]|nr:4-hydroxy-tetrahydrodipicolinate synthase [Pseudohaliea sp.]